jgi:hypothetical protein
MRPTLVLSALLAAAVLQANEEEARPLSPAEAIKQVGKKVTVQFKVRAAKDRLRKRGEIYLDSEKDFKDAKNLAVVVTRAGAAALKKAGIADPAGHFKGKTIRVTGKVIRKDERPRIEVDDARQIKLVEKK